MDRLVIQTSSSVHCCLTLVHLLLNFVLELRERRTCSWGSEPCRVSPQLAGDPTTSCSLFPTLPVCPSLHPSPPMSTSHHTHSPGTPRLHNAPSSHTTHHTHTHTHQVHLGYTDAPYSPTPSWSFQMYRKRMLTWAGACSRGRQPFVSTSRWYSIKTLMTSHKTTCTSHISACIVNTARIAGCGLDTVHQPTCGKRQTMSHIVNS